MEIKLDYREKIRVETFPTCIDIEKHNGKYLGDVISGCVYSSYVSYDNKYSRFQIRLKEHDNGTKNIYFVFVEYAEDEEVIFPDGDLEYLNATKVIYEERATN